MWTVAAGSDDDAAQRRVRLDASLRATEGWIRAARLPIFGVLSPAPSTASLGEAEFHDGEAVKIGVAYGDVDDDAAALVEVTTYAAEDDVDLIWLIQREQDRTGADDPVGAPLPVTIEVDEVPVTGLVREAGQFWGARMSHADVTIAVVARGWPVEAVRLERIVDVEPLLAERRRHLDDLLGRVPDDQPAPPALPTGVDVRRAHRALLDLCLSSAAEPRMPRMNRSAARAYADVWESAVVAQMRLTDDDRDRANEMVGVLVNEMLHLQDRADWFRQDPARREAAIAETLLWVTSLAPQVRSSRAHEAWLALFPPRQLGPTGRPDIAALRAADQAWFAAWSTWADEY